MKQCFELTPDELAELLSGVAEYNGMKVSSLKIYSGDTLVQYDRVVLEGEGATLRVRSSPEPTPTEQLSRMRDDIMGSMMEGLNRENGAE